LNVLFQLNQSLEQLHGLGYTHGDIKLENICVKHKDLYLDSIKLTLIDFGLAYNYSNKLVKNEDPSQYSF
jgi:serine/threonine protein kinase